MVSLSSTLDAQEFPVPAISTERPTAGPSPDIVAAGNLQIESGVGFTHQPGFSVIDLPESFLRLGLTDRIELRFLPSNMAVQSEVPHGTSHLQSQDLAFGVKVLVSGPNKLSPKSAILTLSVPTGSFSLTSNSIDPSVDVIWTQAFHRGFFVNEVAQATLTTLYSARRPLWSPSFAAGLPLSSNLTTFAEYAPNILPDDSRTFLVDTGFALVRHNLQQWDLRFGELHDSLGFHASILVGYSIRKDRFFHVSVSDRHPKSGQIDGRPAAAK